MRRIIICMIMLMFLLSACAVRKNTSIGDSILAEKQQSQEANAPIAFSSYKEGRIDGKQYINEYIGITMDIPEFWDFMNEDFSIIQTDKAIQLEHDFAEKSDGKFFEIGATTSDLFSYETPYGNLNISPEDLRFQYNGKITNYSEITETLKAASEEEIQEVFRDGMTLKGVEDYTYEAGYYKLLGEEVPTSLISGFIRNSEGDKVPCFARGIYLQKECYVLCITITTYHEDTTEMILKRIKSF